MAQEPTWSGLGGIERQPGGRPVEGVHGLRHGRRLARTRGSPDPDHPELIDQFADAQRQPRARYHRTRYRRWSDLGPDHLYPARHRASSYFALILMPSIPYISIG